MSYKPMRMQSLYPTWTTTRYYNMCHALIDADILVYRIGFATNDDDADMAISTMASYIEDILMVDLPEAQTWELFLTGTNNFRKEKAVTAPYKGNRKSEKPVHYT